MKFIYSKTFAFLGVTLVVIVALLFLDTRGYLDPARQVLLSAPQPVVNFFGGVISPVKTFFRTIFTLRDIADENAVLANRVHDLEEQLVRFHEFQAENETLRQQLGFLQKTSLDVVPCSVLAIDPQGVTDTMVINCGDQQGVVDGAGVISGGFLVGTVIHAGVTTSTVLLVTNTNSSVDAKVSGGKTEGVVKGSFGSGIVFDLVPQNSDLEEHDIIVTAGITSKLPKNIVIGEVGETLSRPNDLFKKASLLSPLDFHNVQFVFVTRS